MAQQQGDAKDGSQWVGTAATGDIGSTAVNGLGQGQTVAPVERRGQAQAAAPVASQVGEDVAEQVAGDDQVEGFRLRDQLQGRHIHQAFVHDIGPALCF